MISKLSPRTDFLPIQCNACSLIFCKDHYSYNRHNCPKASDHDHQVPVCPICSKPISFKFGDQPDINMNKHIEEECSNRQLAKQKKIYKNRCSMANCKEKELIELLCGDCRMNYCLKHRHASDHNCSRKYANSSSSSGARQTSASSTAAAAAMQRFMNNSVKNMSNGLNKTTNFVQKLITPNNTPSTTPTNSAGRSAAHVQGGLNEDEALALAIHQSLNPTANPPVAQPTTASQGSRNSPITIGDDEDADLARAIELSKREYERNKEKCALS